MLKCYPVNPGKESLAVQVFGELSEELSHQHKVGLPEQLILVQAEHTKGSSEQESFSVPEKSFSSSFFEEAFCESYLISKSQTRQVISRGAALLNKIITCNSC